MDFKKLTDKAKEVIEERGGSDALKEDAGELRDIAGEKGSLEDKLGDAAKALKDPGAEGNGAQPPERSPQDEAPQPDPQAPAPGEAAPPKA
jgi:hypothetical protein